MHWSGPAGRARRESPFTPPTEPERVLSRITMTHNLTEIFAYLRSITGEANISIKVACDILETVYIQPTDDMRFIVSDGHNTYLYLSQDNLDNYLSILEIGSLRIRQFCSEHHVELIDLYPGDSPDDCDESYAIGVYVNSDDEIRCAVEAVSKCVDAIFSYAMNEKQRRN
jgi:hypothetical protein